MIRTRKSIRHKWVDNVLTTIILYGEVRSQLLLLSYCVNNISSNEGSIEVMNKISLFKYENT